LSLTAQTPTDATAIDDFTYGAAIVPEPLSSSLILVGGIGLLLRRRTHSNKSCRPAPSSHLEVAIL
jgi:hypothetical protein